jgi:hypothetical protein
LAFAVTGVLLLRPYLRVIAAHPEAQRGENWLPLFSPPWRGLLTAPASDWFWGSRQETWRSTLRWQPEMAMSPGVVLLALAVAGLMYSAWPWRRRLGLALATGVLVVLAMGTAFPLGHGEWTYLPLFRYLPGWSAVRTPGRLMIWATLGLCLLAAGSMARFYHHLQSVLAERSQQQGATARSFAVALLMMVPSAAIVAEGLNTTPHLAVPVAPVAMSALRQPVLLLPTDLIGDYAMMLWGTNGWPELANGYSGFDPPAQTALREQARTFPDAASVAALRAKAIRTVVIVRSRAAGGPWATAANRPVIGLGITRTDLADAVVYDLG